MAWTAPRTWVTNEVVTAAIMNAHVRDNLLETAPAKVTSAGDIVYATGANALARLAAPGASGGLLVGDADSVQWRTPTMDVEAADPGLILTLTSYTTGGNPSVTMTTGTRALVIWSCGRIYNNTAGEVCFVTAQVSGASTISAADSRAAYFESSAANDRGCLSHWILAGGGDGTLSAGSNTFATAIRVSGGQGTFDNLRILVIPVN